MSSLEEEFEYHREIQILVDAFQKGMNQVKPKFEARVVSEWIAAIEGAGLALFAKGNLYEFLKTVTGKTGEQFSETCTTMLKTSNMKNIADAFHYSYNKIAETGVNPKEVAPKLLYPMLKGIGEGYSDECIQSKWKKLLTASIAGKNMAVEYIKILDELNPVDARLLDVVYKHRECNINDITSYIEVSSRSIELEMSMSKISETLKLCAITNSDTGNYRKGSLDDVRSILNRYENLSKICRIDTNETSSNGRSIYITVHFSALGSCFMNACTTDLTPNQPSDTSFQTVSS